MKSNKIALIFCSESLEKQSIYEAENQELKRKKRKGKGGEKKPTQTLVFHLPKLKY